MKKLEIHELNVKNIAAFTRQSNEFFRPQVIAKTNTPIKNMKDSIKKSSIEIDDSSPLSIDEKKFLSNLEAPKGNPKNFQSSLFLFNK